MTRVRTAQRATCFQASMSSHSPTSTRFGRNGCRAGCCSGHRDPAPHPVSSCRRPSASNPTTSKLPATRIWTLSSPPRRSAQAASAIPGWSWRKASAPCQRSASPPGPPTYYWRDSRCTRQTGTPRASPCSGAPCACCSMTPGRSGKGPLGTRSACSGSAAGSPRTSGTPSCSSSWRTGCSAPRERQPA